MVTCQKKPYCSSKVFLKQDGVTRIGRWFCSDACSENDEEVKRMVMAQNRLAKEIEEDNEEEIDMTF
jgi:hypothetical protein